MSYSINRFEKDSQGKMIVPGDGLVICYFKTEGMMCTENTVSPLAIDKDRRHITVSTTMKVRMGEHLSVRKGQFMEGYFYPYKLKENR